MRSSSRLFSAFLADISLPFAEIKPHNIRKGCGEWRPITKWPKFRWNSERLAKGLAAVRHRQGRLIGRMEGLGLKLRTEATLRTLTEEVVKTSEIEGEILNKDQVRSSLARRLGVDIGALAPADRNVEGIVEVILDATEKYEEPLSAERLLGWHAALFPTGRSGLRKITVGNWRTEEAGPMQVVSGPIGREHVHYEAPLASTLDHEMKAFLDWFNGDTDGVDPVLKAGIAHLRFVTIHPFEDGNGRIARAITDQQLARSEKSAQRFYSMSAQIRQERNAYYDILESTQKGDLDITPWLQWFLACLDRAFDGAETILGSVLLKAKFWKLHEGESFNIRQRKVLNRVLDGFEGKLTSTKWASLAKCSQDTASRDIDDLLTRKILVKDAAGGRSTNYSLANFE
jgi:Fic family protein